MALVEAVSDGRFERAEVPPFSSRANPGEFSCAMRTQRARARHVEQAGSVVLAETIRNERVHRVRSDAAIPSDLRIDQRRVTEIRGEHRESVGAFASRL